jgi:hypothetical protein
MHMSGSGSWNVIVPAVIIIRLDADGSANTNRHICAASVNVTFGSDLILSISGCSSNVFYDQI